jgi:hypothetical protein
VWLSVATRRDAGWCNRSQQRKVPQLLQPRCCDHTGRDSTEALLTARPNRMPLGRACGLLRYSLRRVGSGPAKEAGPELDASTDTSFAELGDGVQGAPRSVLTSAPPLSCAQRSQATAWLREAAVHKTNPLGFAQTPNSLPRVR